MKLLVFPLVLPLVFTMSISIALFADAQQHKGNNFELTNKSDLPIYFSLSDPVEIFKVPETNKKAVPSFITAPTSYQRAPRAYENALFNFNTYNGKLITLAPDQSLATSVDTTKQVQLLIARGKSPTQLHELELYRFMPNKTLYLKVDKQHTLAPQEGTLKPTLKGLKRFARSGGSLEYNVTPEEIKLVQRTN